MGAKTRSDLKDILVSTEGGMDEGGKTCGERGGVGED